MKAWKTSVETKQRAPKRMEAAWLNAVEMRLVSPEQRPPIEMTHAPRKRGGPAVIRVAGPASTRWMVRDRLQPGRPPQPLQVRRGFHGGISPAEGMEAGKTPMQFAQACGERLAGLIRRAGACALHRSSYRCQGRVGRVAIQYSSPLAPPCSADLILVRVWGAVSP